MSVREIVYLLTCLLRNWVENWMSNWKFWWRQGLLIYLHIHFQGAIVYLSLQISRCHQKVSERKEKPAYARNCLISQISQVVFCHPTTVRRLGEQKGEIQDSGKPPVEWVGHIYNCVIQSSELISFYIKTCWSSMSLWKLFS